jgi:hypothetical protein
MIEYKENITPGAMYFETVPLNKLFRVKQDIESGKT